MNFLFSSHTSILQPHTVRPFSLLCLKLREEREVVENMETKPCSEIKLPPGFRFHPSDEELIRHYLTNKVSSTPLPASIIADIDLYKYDPWELPNKALFGEDEWYFFTPRDRKYPNGARPNRAAASGYWKATATDKPILNLGGTATIGVKKALVFYKGRLPKGIKTDWLMHEYRLMDTTVWSPKRKGSMRLDDWVLCRVRQKSNMLRSTWEDRSDSVQPSGFNYYPKPKALEPFRENTDPNFEMVKSYLCTDFPMLPYIFGSSQDIPFTADVETAASHISFQSPSTEQSSTTTCTDVSSFDNILYQPKRKLEEFSKSSICVYPSKKLMGGADEALSRTDLSEESSFSLVQWIPALLQYPELNQPAFAGSY